MPHQATRFLFSAGVAVVLASAGRAEAGVLSSDPPNVVVICLDTVRYDTYWLPETSGFDDPLRAWNARAARFEQTQSAAPWTVPSVASVLTGRYPLHHNAGRFRSEVANLDTMIPTPLSRQIGTFPQFLMGYDTAAFFTNPFLLPQSGVLRMGIVQYVTDSEQVNLAARRFIDRHADGRRPFFLYLHYMDAHGAASIDAKQMTETVAKIAPGVQEKMRRQAPGSTCANGGDERCLRYLSYSSAVLRMRSYVADVLRQLSDRKLLEHTTVVVFSDHGEEFSDHAEEEKKLDVDPRGLAGVGHGHSLYQELLRVPLVIWHPGWKGADVDVPVSLVDLAPTILGWAGQGATLPFDGIALPDPDAIENDRRQPRILLSSGIAYGPEQISARVGPWKRVFRSAADSTLFSLRRDPGEKTPYRDAIGFDAVDDEILHYSRGTPTDLTPAKLPPEVIKQLRSLGYLSGKQ
ncbi:MAG: sulfatase [Thermoanaerobaculia bacterium]